MRDQHQTGKSPAQVFTRPVPLYVVQRTFNDRYYSSLNSQPPNSSERLGFDTPSQGKTYALLNAREFSEFASPTEGPLRIDEFGAADGVFVRNFLDTLRAERPDVYRRVIYYGWDKSDALRDAFMGEVAVHENVRWGVADVTALKTEFHSDSSDYILCHELFDDLPSRVVYNKEGGIYEIWFVPVNHAWFLADKAELSRDAPDYEQISRFMKGVPDRLRVTFPVDGIKALHGLHALLRSRGILKVFDYGFPDVESLEILAVQASRGNAMGRFDAFALGYSFVGGSFTTAGTTSTSVGNSNYMQLTTPVNFSFLVAAAREVGFDVLSESHLTWASRIAGEPYTSPSHLLQGLAYQAEAARGLALPVGIMELTCTHRIFVDPNIILDTIGIIQRYGETVNALDRIFRKYADLLPVGMVLNAVQMPETEGFVVSSLIFSLAVKLNASIYPRILSKKGSKLLELDLVPESSEAGFRAGFKPEIDELKAMGFDEKAIMWILFCTPHDYSVSGSTIRSSLTLTKQ